jgi:hypothetical protein
MAKERLTCTDQYNILHVHSSAGVIASMQYGVVTIRQGGVCLSAGYHTKPAWTMTLQARGK